MTVSGTAISLARGSSDVIVGGSTEALGPYITAGFGKGAGNGSVGVAFEGGTGGRGGCGWSGVGVMWTVWMVVGLW